MSNIAVHFGTGSNHLVWFRYPINPNEPIKAFFVPRVSFFYEPEGTRMTFYLDGLLNEINLCASRDPRLKRFVRVSWGKATNFLDILETGAILLALPKGEAHG